MKKPQTIRKPCEFCSETGMIECVKTADDIFDDKYDDGYGEEDYDDIEGIVFIDYCPLCDGKGYLVIAQGNSVLNAK